MDKRRVMGEMKNLEDDLPRDTAKHPEKLIAKINQASNKGRQPRSERSPGLVEHERQSVANALTELQPKARSIKRLQTPEDLMGTVVFLASSDSDFMTGQTIVVDGGSVFH